MEINLFPFKQIGYRPEVKIKFVLAGLTSDINPCVSNEEMTVEINLIALECVLVKFPFTKLQEITDNNAARPGCLC